MEPSFYDGEYLVIDELSYFLREPRRGEVIVFRNPNNRSQFFIKRIVGLPGETVVIEDGKVEIQSETYPQGALLDETDYLPTDVRTGGRVTMTMGEEEMFVLGDNRSASSDSRSWGVLEADEIVGRAWIRAFPIDRLDVLEVERPGFVGAGGG